VQDARREREHLGRFAARNVSVRVQLQVAANVHAEDAPVGAVREDIAAAQFKGIRAR
jgi:hypothetical protein